MRRPFWIDRFPNSRRPSFPRHRGETTADVVIVGGGLTGAACAATFATAGIRVVLLEADRIGAGTTGRSAGLIREDVDAAFHETTAAHGLRAARLLWQGMRRASLDFAASLRRLQIRCDLAPTDLMVLSRRDPRSLRKDYEARRAAGLDASWLTPAAIARVTAVERPGGAIRTHGASFDPFRACVGLVGSATKRGAVVFEGTPVTRIRAGRKQVEIGTGSGTVTAQAAVIATAAPIGDLSALQRHLRPHHGYAVVTEPLPATIRREVGGRTAALRDDECPPHILRWLKEDRVLFTGADGPPVPERAREKVLRQRAGQLMYELSLMYPPISGTRAEWSWDYEHHETVDGLPYVGTHRNFPRHLFALGHARHGAGVAWLAARVLLRAFQGTPVKGDELFGFARILGPR